MSIEYEIYSNVDLLNHPRLWRATVNELKASYSSLGIKITEIKLYIFGYNGFEEFQGFDAYKKSILNVFLNLASQQKKEVGD